MKKPPIKYKVAKKERARLEIILDAKIAENNLDSEENKLKILEDQYKNTENFENASEDFCLQVVKRYPERITLLSESQQTYKVCVNALLAAKEKHMTDIVYSLIKNPSDMVIRRALILDGSLLSIVPENRKTYDLCFRACENYPDALKYVPDKFIDKNLLLIIAQKSPNTLFYVSNKYLDEDIMEMALKTKSTFFSNIPEALQTNRIVKFGLELDPKNIKYVKNPTESQITQALKANPYCLQFIEQNLLTQEHLELACCNIFGRGNIRHIINMDLFTEEFLIKVLQKNPMDIRYINIEYQTQKMADIAIQDSTVSNIAYIKPEFLTEEMCLINMEKTNGLSFSYIPKNLMSENLCMIAMSYCWRNFNSIPKSKYTDKIIRYVVCHNGLLISDIPQKFLTREVCLLALQQNKEAVKYINITAFA